MMLNLSFILSFIHLLLDLHLILNADLYLPLLFFWIFFSSVNSNNDCLGHMLITYPADTGRKLIVHKAFRRGPGRPVPTGSYYKIYCEVCYNKMK